jgi:tRNA dimethylallyltransferase
MEMKSTETPIFIVGATGTGKSAAALELARAFGGSKGAAILAMDAMQVYRGADIGTSKPTGAEQAEIPHGGLDLVEFNASFDVAQYLKHAAAFLREQREAARRVIIVGGTGLYFRALTQGLCEAPQGEDELRAELNGLSVEELQARLKRVDPGMLERLDQANPRRLVRAIEVMEATGRSLNEWQKETPEPLIKDFQAFGIERTKEELNERIAARVEAMFAQGWVEEVRGLVEMYGLEVVRGFAGIGYREIGEWVGNPVIEPMAATGEAEGPPAGTAAATLKSDILVSTRQYAKRQLTWFRREPKLQPVMLSGSQPFPAEALSLS